MKLLRTLDWAHQSIQLLEYLKTNDTNNTLLLFIRHSERFNPEDFDEIQKALLTEVGKQAAFEFGENLPEKYRYFLYHSPLTRCKQTANEIERALCKRKIFVAINGKIEALYRPKLDCDLIKEVLIQDRHDFIYKWLENQYTEEIIENSHDYSLYVYNIIMETLSKHINTNEKQMFIFVGHDMNLITFRYNWFNLSIPDDWLLPLSGFIIQLLDKEHIIFDPIIKKTFKKSR